VECTDALENISTVSIQVDQYEVRGGVGDAINRGLFYADVSKDMDGRLVLKDSPQPGTHDMTVADNKDLNGIVLSEEWSRQIIVAAKINCVGFRAIIRHI
jgi:hypothetical protein